MLIPRFGLAKTQFGRSQNRTGCYPWYIPRWNTNSSICEGKQAYLFMEKKFDGYCDCPANCEEVVFSSKESVVPINAERECQRDETGWDDLRRIVFPKFRLHQLRSGMMFWRLYQLEHDMDISLMNIEKYGTFLEFMPYWEQKFICQEYMQKDFALLNFEIAVPQMQSIKRERRVTFSDQLGTLGNLNLTY